MGFFRKKGKKLNKPTIEQMLGELATRNVEFDKDVQDAFDNVGKDVSNLLKGHNELSSEFYELRDEIATNGVVRDLRALQKEVAELREFKATVEGNGVATAINKLQEEVFGKKKKAKEDTVTSLLEYYSGWRGLSVNTDQPTLAGKVDAIIDHLGIDLTVKPAESTPAKVVAVKKKAVSKKRRR